MIFVGMSRLKQGFVRTRWGKYCPGERNGIFMIKAQNRLRLKHSPCIFHSAGDHEIADVASFGSSSSLNHALNL